MLDHIFCLKVRQLTNGSIWYQFKPIEADANAASALFLRRHYPGALDAILDTADAPLARSNTGPGDLRDLPAKTVGVMFNLREVAESPESWDGLPIRFVDRLRDESPEAARIWETLSGRIT